MVKVKAEISDALAKKFRKRAMEIYGYKKGALKTAFEDMMKRFIASGEVDWKKFEGMYPIRVNICGVAAQDMEEG